MNDANSVAVFVGIKYVHILTCNGLKDICYTNKFTIRNQGERLQPSVSYQLNSAAAQD